MIIDFKDKVDINELKKYESDKLISLVEHSSLPLTIANYSNKAQFDNVWDDITNNCRGTIFDNNNNLVSKPFKKFWSITQDTVLPDEPFEVFDKLDGSLFIVTKYNGEVVTATRGSFTSEQAIEGRNILESKYGFESIREGYTYLFEVIYPNNMIVVDYNGLRDIVLIAVVDNDKHSELSYEEIKNLGFNCVRRFDGLSDFESIQTQFESLPKNSEGFVVRFKSGFRVKMKTDLYKSLHKVLFLLSNKTIWEFVSTNNGDYLSVFPNLPDKVRKYIETETKMFLNKYKIIETSCLEQYERIKNFSTRKEQALAIQDFEYKSVVFSLLSGADYKQHIWKIIKPKYVRVMFEPEI